MPWFLSRQFYTSAKLCCQKRYERKSEKEESQSGRGKSRLYPTQSESSDDVSTFSYHVYIRMYVSINILMPMFSCDISEAKKKKLDLKDIILDDSKKPEPADNVWIAKFHKWKINSFEEAVQNHRETHHPTIYNLPNAQINALIELDMQVKKKEKSICKI